MKKNKINFLIVIDWLITPMMEIGSEIGIEKALDEKEVFILIVDDYIKSEGFNSRLPKFISKYDIPKKLEEIILSKKHENIKISLKKIDKNIEEEFWPKEIKNAFLQIQENQFNSINKYLRSIILNNVNVGEGILSSIISTTKKRYPTYLNDKKTIKEVFNLFVRRYFMYSKFFKEDLDKENLVIFNGRFASSKAIESGISKNNIKKTKFLYYERSHTFQRYTLKPYKVHDRKKIINEINESWINSNKKNEASKIAETYFKIKISGRGTDWFPYSKGIQENKDNFITSQLNDYKNKKGNKILSYFSSSEDEFESLGDVWSDKRFNLSQEQIIRELSRISEKKNMKLIIRLHPNLDNSSYESKAKWGEILSKLPKNNTLIIKQDDKISSYKIINKSDIVVVYGSTVGVEALYLKRPVIIAGPSFYLGTSAKIIAAFKLKDIEKNINDLIKKNFLNDLDNKKLLKESSYPYGYWAYTHGFKYKNFKPFTPVRGYLIKYDLQKVHRILSKFKKILQVFFKF